MDITNLSDHLLLLMRKGARFNTPEGQQHWLAYAWSGQTELYAWMSVLCSDPEGWMPSGRSYRVRLFDLDPVTGKCYIVINDADYVQVTPLDFDEIAAHREWLETAYLRLTNQVLPERAKRRHWVITENHCFQRIILDHHFGGPWYDYLPKRNQPAYQQLRNDQLGWCVYFAYQMYFAADDQVRSWNADSLAFRKKSDEL